MDWRDIEQHQAHVWIADLALQGQPFLCGYLSKSEKIHAAKFHFSKDRIRYEKTRGILRLLLGRYFNAPPEKIEISTTEFGKPYISKLLNGKELCFNLAHSGEIAVYAFTLYHPIGVDVEILRPIPDLDELAGSFFTTGERKFLQSIESQARAKVFLQYWTRKEAYLKAIGLGLSISPEEVDVSSLPISSPQLTIFHPQIKSDHNTWSLMDFFPTSQSIAAVAVDSRVTQIEFRHCEER